MAQPSRHSRELATKLLNMQKAQVVQPKYMKGSEYAHCWWNVERAASEFGGKVVSGWNLFENEYMVEAEAHGIWCDDKGSWYNITPPLNQKKPVSCLFLPDARIQWRLQVERVPSNVLLWKNRKHAKTQIDSIFMTTSPIHLVNTGKTRIYKKLASDPNLVIRQLLPKQHQNTLH
jgi:hypothetical protein